MAKYERSYLGDPEAQRTLDEHFRINEGLDMPVSEHPGPNRTVAELAAVVAVIIFVLAAM